ncbi:MAG: hypothetical protein Q8L24_01605 [bacterium]|nr:hypothetical protein [bacterium]
MNKNSPSSVSGQSLIEILLGVAIGAILIGGAAATITLTLRSNVQNKNIQTASALAQAMLDKVTVFADADWHNIDGTLNCGPAGVLPNPPNPAIYNLVSSGTALECGEGMHSGSVDAGGIAFSTSFKVESVSRDKITDSIASSGDVYSDPSTKKIVATAIWFENGQEANVTVNKYITRSRNIIFKQSGWDGGETQITFPSGGTVVNNKFDASSGIKFSEIGALKKLGF